MAAVKFDTTELETDYYQINNTKKVLYWDADQQIWFKPTKDQRKNYSGWLENLESQPKNIKSVVVANSINGQKIQR